MPAYSPPKAPKGKEALPEAQHVGWTLQPISAVVWVERDSLRANDWNPNRTATPEMTLLAISILEDGWTQPIVARPDGTIVDGFHRWTVAGWPKVAAMTEGKVPVSYLHDSTDAQLRMATIRHNRARGTHYVLSMADIVAELVEMGVSQEEIAQRVQMDPEEVVRLMERGNMIKRGQAPDGFNEAWKPEHR